ncbi:excinuclease ABC subunit UvrC [Patescibacteria group bacterium]|nr:MAG: excinuclease ABC subunit UvrC [Patescibacteria group bacterium]
MPSLFNNLKHIPRSPGVYFFKDAKGKILYIGKAKDLQKRISQYKQGRIVSPQTDIMLSKAAKIDFLVASSEVESLVWENNLIKEHQPKYNIRLRDDKDYLYIKISDEPFPKITAEHRANLSGGELIGPFTSSEYVQTTLKTIRKIFPYRTCNTLPKKPCLYFFIKLCPAPCVGKILQSDYAETIQKIRQIILGKDKKIIGELKAQMRDESSIQNYEKAAALRNQWQALEHVYGRNIATTGDEDFFSIAKTESYAAAHLFIIRDKKMIRSETFLFDRAKDYSEGEILQSAILNFYEHAASLPKNIIALRLPANFDLTLKWLKAKAEKLEVPAPKFIIAKRGLKARLLKTGQRNALEKISWHKISQTSVQKQAGQSADDWQKISNLSTLPRRIECYDISNIQGTDAVGSMVVFENGRPKKSDYRRFIIKTIFGANDPAMMEEVISRRLNHKEWPMPDLILLDGGLPQLSAVFRLFKEKNIKIPLAALAKKEEEIYIPHQLQPIRLPKNSPALHILQAIRDEAHRFAIAHYRQRHRKKIINKL